MESGGEARPVIVAIAGGSGAGKTTLVRRLASALGDDLVVIEQDSYYLDQSTRTPDERCARNFDHPDALDLAQLAVDLTTITRGRVVEVPLYDFTTHTRRRGVLRTEPRPFVAVEGTLVLHSPEVRRLASVCVYVEADAVLRLDRRIERDVRERGRTPADVRAQVAATVAPMHRRFVEPQRDCADLVIHCDDERGLAAGMDTLLTMLVRARSRKTAAATRAPTERS